MLVHLVDGCGLHSTGPADRKSGLDAILTIGSQSWGMLVKLLGVLVHVSRCNETDSGVSLERIAD